MMNYIIQLNTFENLCTGILPPKAQLIYYKLFKWSNRFGLGKPFRLSNSILMLETGITNINTFTLNRNILKQQGFIDFKPGRPGKQTEYVLLDLEKYTYNMLPQTEPQTEPNTELQTEPTAELQAEPQAEPPFIYSNTNIQSNKKQNKTKQINLSDSETGFDVFWEHYPRHEGKVKARESFIKALRKGVKLDELVAAIEKHKQSAQWQKDGGQYIPHPATWLNQQRWEDEVLTGVPQQQNFQAPIRKNDAQAGYARAAQILGITEGET
jgi:hypothetical protein